jgi:hypothetical protein
VGKDIHESGDKATWATAMLALAKKLEAVDGAQQAAEQVLKLAAVALGDVEQNGLLCK